MSPETKRASHGWAKHERSRKAAERKLASATLVLPTTTPEDRQRKLNTASWASVKGLLNLATSNNDLLHSVYEEVLDYTETRELVKGWYDAAYKDATTGNGQENKHRNDFTKKHLLRNSEEAFDPILVLKTKPLLKMVDSFLFKTA